MKRSQKNTAAVFTAKNKKLVSKITYSLTQNHGSAYCIFQHFGSEGIHSIAYHRLTPTAGSLQTLAILCLSSS